MRTFGFHARIGEGGGIEWAAHNEKNHHKYFCDPESWKLPEVQKQDMLRKWYNMKNEKNLHLSFASVFLSTFRVIFSFQNIWIKQLPKFGPFNDLC